MSSKKGVRSKGVKVSSVSNAKNRITVLLATMFYAGKFPWMPGTAGTFVAALIIIAEFLIWGGSARTINVCLFFICVVPSIIISGRAEKIFRKKDAQEIVIDEVMGMWLAVLGHTLSIPLIVIAFILFRVFDIVKPFPASTAQRLRGGLGVVTDDLVAGVYVNLSLWIIIFIFDATGMAFL